MTRSSGSAPCMSQARQQRPPKGPSPRCRWPRRSGVSPPRRASTVSLRRAAPYKRQAALRQQRPQLLHARSVHTGQRNTAPMEARTVLGLYRSAQAFTKNNPSASKGVRRAEDGPHIAGILHPVQDDVPAARSAVPAKRPARQAADGEDALGRLCRERWTSSRRPGYLDAADTCRAEAGRGGGGPCRPLCAGSALHSRASSSNLGLSHKELPAVGGDKKRRTPACGDGCTADWSGW